MSEFADETAVEPSDESAVVEEPAAEPAAPAAPAEPSLDPREVQAQLEYLAERNSQLEGYLQQIAEQGQSQTPQQQQDIYQGLVDEYGQLDVQKFAQLQTARDQALLAQIGQMFTPIQETFQSQQEASVIAEGEQRLADILADDVSRNGEFHSDPEVDGQIREMIAERASQLFPDLADRYGANPRSAEMAMTRAAAEYRDLTAKIGGQAVQQNQNQLANLANAKSEIGGTVAGTEAPVIRMGETSASRFAAGQNA